MRSVSGWTLATLMVVGSGISPRPAQSQELLSWWKRDLIEVDLRPGTWVTYSSTEFSEGEIYADTLTVRVVATVEDSLRWVEIDDHRRFEREFLLIDPTRLRPDRSLLDALDRHLRLLPSGEVVEERVEELRSSRLVQRHFQDLFTDPVVTRESRPDTLLAMAADSSCAREHIRLAERREEPAPVGASIMVTQIQSDAILSPCIPIFSVLRARTVTELSTRASTNSGPRSRKVAPLRTVLEWHCIAFGEDGPTELPPELLARD